MAAMYMTRGDENVGEGKFDSIAWIYEIYLVNQEDTGRYNFAILIGPEEHSATEIMLWREEPKFDQKPDAYYKLVIGKNGEKIWEQQ